MMVWWEQWSLEYARANKGNTYRCLLALKGICTSFATSSAHALWLLGFPPNNRVFSALKSLAPGGLSAILITTLVGSCYYLLTIYAASTHTPQRVCTPLLVFSGNWQTHFVPLISCIFFSLNLFVFSLVIDDSWHYRPRRTTWRPKIKAWFSC